MTTILPAGPHAIPLTIVLTSPLHHGAGTTGNTSLLRTETMVGPDGQQYRVPYLSGNSVRHGLRAALAWHLAGALAIPEGSLSKGVVDLLWSGGAVTTTGARTDLDLARRVEDVFPALGMLGYAAGSDIVAGTLRVSALHLVCRENRWRLPADLAESPHAVRGAAHYRDEEFGTRHDVASSPVARFLAAAQQMTTAQMIYDVQVLRPGSVLCGDLGLTAAATAMHRTVLGAALALWAPEEGGQRVVRLGAKTAVGFGTGTLAVPDRVDADLEAWTAHIQDRGEDILTVLAELAGAK